MAYHQIQRLKTIVLNKHKYYGKNGTNAIKVHSRGNRWVCESNRDRDREERRRGRCSNVVISSGSEESQIAEE